MSGILLKKKCCCVSEPDSCYPLTPCYLASDICACGAESGDSPLSITVTIAGVELCACGECWAPPACTNTTTAEWTSAPSVGPNGTFVLTLDEDTCDYLYDTPCTGEFIELFECGGAPMSDPFPINAFHIRYSWYGALTVYYTGPNGYEGYDDFAVNVFSGDDCTGDCFLGACATNSVDCCDTSSTGETPQTYGFWSATRSGSAAWSAGSGSGRCPGGAIIYTTTDVSAYGYIDIDGQCYSVGALDNDPAHVAAAGAITVVADYASCLGCCAA